MAQRTIIRPAAGWPRSRRFPGDPPRHSRLGCGFFNAMAKTLPTPLFYAPIPVHRRSVPNSGRVRRNGSLAERTRDSTAGRRHEASGALESCFSPLGMRGARIPGRLAAALGHLPSASRRGKRSTVSSPKAGSWRPESPRRYLMTLFVR